MSPTSANKIEIPSRFVAAAAAITAPVEMDPPVNQPAAPSPPSKTLAPIGTDTEVALPSSLAIAALFHVSSAPPSQWRRWARNATANTGSDGLIATDSYAQFPEVGVLKIKNLDTGKEFVVSSDNKVVGKLKDPQTMLLTMDEFEKLLGSSRIVKEVMRRATDTNTAIVSTTNRSKSTWSGKQGKKKANWLKNIKFVASTVTHLMSEKEKANSSERLKVHHHGKSYNELTGLYMCQEIQAHQGSIWVMKFS